MKNLANRIISFISLIVLSAFAAGVWWGLWMNYSWPGPTGLIAKILHADGEYYYNAIFDEMFFIAVILLTGVFFIWRHSKKWR